MKNQRKFDRHSMVATVTLTVPGKNIRTKGYTFNVSYTGIGIYSEELLPIGEEVIMTIVYGEESGISTFETISGIVKWCKIVGDRFAAGMEFKEVDPNEHPMLFFFLKKAEGFRKN